MNMIIDDTDHPLIIKVASIQSARMQVYFIDNDDYFHPRLMTTDENGVEYEDNDERAIFYARGVLETVKKLRWCPDIIHCHGWMSAMVPLYIKTAYRDEPSFRDSRVVYSMYKDGFQNNLKENFKNQVLFKDMTAEQLEGISAQVNASELNKLAIQYSDGLIQSAPDVHPELMEYAQQRGILTLPYQGEENYASSFCDFYDQVWSVGKEEVIEEEE